MSGTPWLDNLHISEFSELIERKRSTLAEPDRCGALPARAFWDRYPAGCLRDGAHTGSHAPEMADATRLDTAAHRRAGR